MSDTTELSSASVSAITGDLLEEGLLVETPARRQKILSTPAVNGTILSFSWDSIGTVMPKQKTNRSAAKRFRKTGSGKFRRNKAFHSHILTKKSPKRKRQLGATLQIADADVKAVRKMLPYS